MQLKSKVNHDVADYFRRSLQTPSTNMSDSNMSLPYRYEFFSGLNKLPFLSSEPELINFPINQDNVQEFYTTLHECTNNLQTNVIPRHNTGFSNDLIEVEDAIGNHLNKNHLSPDDLALVDEDTICIYNGTKTSEHEATSKSICTEVNNVQKNDHGVKMLHPTKPNVTAVSILDIVPLDVNYFSTFQVMLDSKDEDIDTILELHEGWKYPSTRFSFYSKIDDKLYKHDRDFSSSLPREYTKSYIVSLPRSFVERDKNDESLGVTNSEAYLISTRSPKLLLSKVSSVKKKPKIKLL